MKIGDITYKHAPSVYNDEAARVNDNQRTIPGIIVYIHPQRKYYTVEFTFKHYKFRESYCFKGEI